MITLINKWRITAKNSVLSRKVLNKDSGLGSWPSSTITAGQNRRHPSAPAAVTSRLIWLIFLYIDFCPSTICQQCNQHDKGGVLVDLLSLSMNLDKTFKAHSRHLIPQCTISCSSLFNPPPLLPHKGSSRHFHLRSAGFAPTVPTGALKLPDCLFPREDVMLMMRMFPQQLSFLRCLTRAHSNDLMWPMLRL